MRAKNEPTTQEIAEALEWLLETRPSRRANDRDEAIEIERLRRVPALRSKAARSGEAEVLKLAALKLIEQRLNRLPGDDREVAEILLGYQTSIDQRTREIAALRGVTPQVARRLRRSTINRMAAALLDADETASPSVFETDDRSTSTRRFRTEIILAIVVGVIGVAATFYVAVLQDTFADDPTAAEADAGGAPPTVTSGEPAVTTTTSTTSGGGTASTNGSSLGTEAPATSLVVADTSGVTAPVTAPSGPEPPGDARLALRIDNPMSSFLEPGESLIVDVVINIDNTRPRWMILELNCMGQSGEHPNLDAVLEVTPLTGTVRWTPPNPVVTCREQVAQGPVVSGHYYYRIEMASTENVEKAVGATARFVHTPITPTWDGRIVLPMIETRPGSSVRNVLRAGAAHSYLFELVEGEELTIVFGCNEGAPLDEVPIQVRLLDGLAREVSNEVYDDCGIHQTPPIPSDGDYEMQLMAADPADETRYQLAAPRQTPQN